jgi:hypothetical protein
MYVGEITPTATRYQDLLPRRIGMVNHKYAPTTLASSRGAHKPCPAGAEDNRVIGRAGHSEATVVWK